MGLQYKPPRLISADATGFRSCGTDKDATHNNAGYSLISHKNLHFRYQLVREDGVTVIKAASEASASGLLRRFEINGP